MNKRLGFPESSVKYTKFSISLSEETEMYLDKLKYDIRQESGARISRSEIIRAALRYVKTLNFDISDIKDENDIVESLKQVSKK